MRCNSIQRLLIVMVLGIFLIGSCGQPAEDLPETILGFKRTKLISGEEAKEQVNRLHQKPVTNQQNLIGYYTAQNEQAIIYVTVYKNKALALSEEKRMTDKISPENSVFIMGKKLNIKNKPVYRCYGMGQTHFVFSEDNKLYWISVGTVSSQKFLEAFLSYLD